MKEQTKLRLLVAVPMFTFGTLGLFTRNIDLSSGELALCRACLAALLIIVFLTVTKQGFDLKSIKKDVPFLAASGVAMGINWIFLFEAYKYTTISLATLSYYFAPVIVTAASPILFHERLTKKQVICFVMSTLGLVLIIGVGGGGSGNGTDLLGILFGLLAAVFYATVILLNKFIKDVEGIQRTLLQFIAAIVILIPYVALTGGLRLSALSGVGIVCLLTVGFIHTGVTYCMYFTGLKDLSGQEASILSYIDPLTAVIVSTLFLGESISALQLLGGALILGFTIWNEIGQD
ncbi:MAG TPA: EamA family transporter [Candidatus Avilachnospira avistercoris]|nr:EamA family transporter [Candidatus Avilachnospira avistercoris]